MKNKKKGRFTSVLLVIILAAGLSLVLYPSVANYVNSKHSSRAIATYSEAVGRMSQEEYDRLWQEASKYNDRLFHKPNQFSLSDSEREEYNSLLNISGDGVMGYIEIPAIGVSLPIYHGTSDAVLQVAVGHLDWTSLPVGGAGTHCVLSGHRGLPSAKLFTNLDRLTEGNTFLLRVLNEVLTYEVDQILIVEPNDISALQIVPNQDYCTLVTCTPYGINTHRLLVRGHRIETEAEAAAIHIVAEAVQVSPVIIALSLGLPAVVILFIIIFAVTDIRKKHSGKSRRSK